MTEFYVEQVLARPEVFCRYHRLHAPRKGGALRLGSQIGPPGGYGTLFGVQADPPAAGPAIVAKVFHTDDPAERRRVAGLIGVLHSALERCPDPGWPERLLALPFALLEGRFEGETKLVALMLDLRAFGYEEITLKGDEWEEYQDRQPFERLEYAYNFARVAGLLESVSFLHADINLKNILIRRSDADVQIIDFDGGAVVRRGDERGKVVGKADDFVPPEAKIVNPPGVDVAAYSIEAERWSVGLMVGMLLFGVGVYFFLTPLSGITLDVYAGESGSWPDVDVASPRFNYEDLASYEDFKPVFEAAPGETRARFADLFAAGSNSAERPTAAAWVAALEVARQPPEFEYLRVEPDVQVEGSEILVSWSAKNVESVRSELFGSLEAEGSRTYVVGGTTRFEFEAANRFGTTVGTTNRVRVVSLPRMESVSVPAFPGIRATFKIPGTVALPPPQSPSPPRLASAVQLPGPLALMPTQLRPGSAPVRRLPSFGTLLSGLWGTLAKAGGR